jgi:DTW domain-containing protein YfiP
VALLANQRLALVQLRRSEQEQTHAAAEALVAALLPGDPAARAQAIAEGALP